MKLLKDDHWISVEEKRIAELKCFTLHKQPHISFFSHPASLPSVEGTYANNHRCYLSKLTICLCYLLRIEVFSFLHYTADPSDQNLTDKIIPQADNYGA